MTGFSARFKHLGCLLQTLSIKPALQSFWASERGAEEANRLARKIFIVPKLARNLGMSLPVFKGLLPVGGRFFRARPEPSNEWIAFCQTEEKTLGSVARGNI